MCSSIGSLRLRLHIPFFRIVFVSGTFDLYRKVAGRLRKGNIFTGVCSQGGGIGEVYGVEGGCVVKRGCL